MVVKYCIMSPNMLLQHTQFHNSFLFYVCYQPVHIYIYIYYACVCLCVFLSHKSQLNQLKSNSNKSEDTANCFIVMAFLFISFVKPYSRYLYIHSILVIYLSQSGTTVTILATED
jgi:hypothetical protein